MYMCVYCCNPLALLWLYSNSSFISLMVISQTFPSCPSYSAQNTLGLDGASQSSRLLSATVTLLLAHRLPCMRGIRETASLIKCFLSGAHYLACWLRNRELEELSDGPNLHLSPSLSKAGRVMALEWQIASVAYRWYDRVDILICFDVGRNLTRFWFFTCIFPRTMWENGFLIFWSLEWMVWFSYLV